MTLIDNLKAIWNLDKLDIKQSTDEEYIKSLLESTNKHRNILKVTCIIFLVLSLLFLAIAIITGISRSSLYGELEKEYGKDFLTKKAYMEVEIQTARIESVSSHLAYTDLGVVEFDTKPRSSVMLIFSDIDDKLQSITKIDKLNNLTKDTFEYVSTGYKIDENTELIINTDYDRLHYKQYLGESVKLAELKNRFQVSLGIAIVTIIVLCLLAAMLSILNKGRYKILIAGIEIVESQAEMLELTQRREIENRNRFKRGTGANGGCTGEQYKRAPEDAIANEGLTFTGTSKASNKTSNESKETNEDSIE